MGQVVKLDKLINELAPVRTDRRVVFTNGCFDLLHVGHVRYLQEAKKLGDILIVGANSDASVRGLKGEDRPVQTEEDRAEILAALESVDFVVLFSEPTPIQLIEAIRPDVLVKGGDWPVEKIVGHEIVLDSGGEVKSLGYFKGKSTSSLISKILSLG